VTTFTVVEGPKSAASPDQIEGLQGDRLPVIDGVTGQKGFVDRAAILSSGGQQVPDVSPVYDADGHQIAYWGNGLGWLSRDQVEAPGFDYQALYAQRYPTRNPAQPGE
jgi:hypothetical protein